ncbi:MAG: MotA/TolQ/ExbB proton channel family protein [Alphaproteobacteria bacterium]|nr:MotA/TolQ/ExbB proton channel family protein [Alphaproteobacteria bacterium]
MIGDAEGPGDLATTLEALAALVERLGPVGPALIVCAAAAFLIVLERGAALAIGGRLPRGRVTRALAAAAGAGRADLADALGDAPALMRTGARVLLDARPQDKASREEAASLWLEGVRDRLNRRLGLLQLIATLSPMLGLLGTVLGMVVAFQAIAEQEGPVHPALLADGLWQAMLTTVVGLAIALPATAARWALAATAEARVAGLAGALSLLSLRLEAEAAGGAPIAASATATRELAA